VQDQQFLICAQNRYQDSIYRWLTMLSVEH